MADNKLVSRAQSPSSAPMPSKVSFWNDPNKRALLFQIVLLLAIFAFFAYLFHNTLSNLEKRGINTGFGFLSNTAGFGISQTLIPYSEASTFGRTFVVGLLNTLLVSALGIVAATILGFMIGIGRLSRNWLLSKVSMVYIETFRNIPLLLQIVFWYMAIIPLLPMPRGSYTLGEVIFLNRRGLVLPEPLPEEGFLWTVITFALALALVFILRVWARKRQEKTGQIFPVFWAGLGLLMGLPLLSFLFTGMPLHWDIPTLKGFNFQGGISIIPELGALWLALSIYTAAFIAEIVRSGIQSVSKGQTEAAASLGLKPNRILQLVIVPQAMRVVIPQLTSQYLNLTKNSSLAVAIAYPDLVAVFAGTTLNQTGQAVEIIFITMLVYLTISLTISLIMNGYNRRVALVER